MSNLKQDVERLLCDTHLPVASGDERRIDLVVSGLSIVRRVPFFDDITYIPSISA
jgi:hypothetical protein